MKFILSLVFVACLVSGSMSLALSKKSLRKSCPPKPPTHCLWAGRWKRKYCCSPILVVKINKCDLNLHKSYHLKEVILDEIYKVMVIGSTLASQLDFTCEHDIWYFLKCFSVLKHQQQKHRLSLHRLSITSTVNNIEYKNIYE
jgi:hypothetical protein